MEQRGALADRGARSHLSQHPLLLSHRPCGKTQDSESAELCSFTSLALGWSPALRSKHITTSVLEFPMKRKWYMPDHVPARHRDSHMPTDRRQRAFGDIFFYFSQQLPECGEDRVAEITRPIATRRFASEFQLNRGHIHMVPRNTHPGGFTCSYSCNVS